MDLDNIIEHFDPAQLADPGFLEQLRSFIDYIEGQLWEAREAARRKELGEDRDVSQDFLYAVFDQRHMTDRPERKWYSPNTQIGDRVGASRLTKKKGICIHHTAVRGGFGVARGVAWHYAAVGVQEYDEKLWLVRPQDGAHGRPAEPTLEEWARAMALAHRYRGDPPRKFNTGVSYHAISAPNSVLYLNLPFDWVTWHGDGANTDYLGYAWDALSTAESPNADDLIADLRFLVKLARAEGHPCTHLTTHSVWTNKPHDPGKEFVEKVMTPLADELGLVIDWNFKSAARGARSLAETIGRAP